MGLQRRSPRGLSYFGGVWQGGAMIRPARHSAKVFAVSSHKSGLGDFFSRTVSHLSLSYKTERGE